MVAFKMNRIECPQCGHRLKYGDEFAGKKAKCQKCAHSFRLAAAPVAEPMPADELNFIAPQRIAGTNDEPVNQATANSPCSRCGQEAGQAAVAYEYYAYQFKKTKIQVGGLPGALLSERQTYHGLTRGSGFACDSCIAYIRRKYRTFWWIGGSITILTAIACGVGAAYLEQPISTLLIGAIFLVLIVGFAMLALFFPLTKEQIGQRLVIAPLREMLNLAGLCKIRGGQYDGPQGSKQFVTRLFVE